MWMAPVSRHTQAEAPNSLMLTKANASWISLKATGIGAVPRAAEIAVEHAPRRVVQRRGIPASRIHTSRFFIERAAGESPPSPRSGAGDEERVFVGKMERRLSTPAVRS